MPRTTEPMSQDLLMGCDPGKSGAFALLDYAGNYVDVIRMDLTPNDIGRGVRHYRRRIAFALIEQVGAMPKDARSAAFKFGTSFGIMWGMLCVCNIRHEFIRPHDWQGKMSCRSKGDKNITKAAAQRLFPDIKVIHANADALLLAELARRTALERGWL